MTIIADQIFVTVNGARRSLAWLAENASAARVVWVENCPGLAAMPDLSAALAVANSAGGNIVVEE